MTAKPTPASSVILKRGARFLLVKRGHPPAKAMYAFPGGRAEAGETPEQTALRELKEETGLEARDAHLFAVYDLIDRDDDGEISSFFRLSVFLANVDSLALAVAADDADELGWYTLDEIRALPVPTSVLECAEKLAGPD